MIYAFLAGPVLSRTTNRGRMTERRPLKDSGPLSDSITSMVTLTQGRAQHWDVINEAYAHHNLIDILGREEMAEWFRVARAADPDVRLYYNDYTMLSGGGLNLAGREHFFETLRFLKDSGAPIDGFGEQAHFG